MRSRFPGLRVVLALLTIYCAWGSSYLAIRVGVQDLPPLLFSALRFLLAAPLMFAYAWWRGDRLPRSRRDWLILVMTALFMLVLSSGLVAWSEQWVASGETALIVASSALWIVWFGSWGKQGEPVTGLSWAGLSVGLFGVAILVTAGKVSGAAPLFAYAGLVVSAIGWSAGSMILRRHTLACGPMMTAALHMAIAGFFMGIAGLLLGERAHLNWSRDALAALLYLSLFGTCIAYGAYYWLLRHAAPALIGSFAYVTPVVAVLLGAFLLDEPMSRLQLAGSVLVLSSVLIAGYSASRVRLQAPQ